MAKFTAKTMSAEKLVAAIKAAAIDKKAENVVVLDLRGRNAPAQFFVVCEGEVAVHNQAIASAVNDTIFDMGVKAWHVEGTEEGRWILIDYADVMVHVMLPEARKLYALEEYWSTLTPVSDDDEDL